MGLNRAGYGLEILCVLQDHSLASVLDSATALLGLGSAQHAPDDVRVLPVLPFALLPLAVHHGGVHVGWRKCVGFIQQRDHAQEDGPGNQQTRAGKSRGGSATARVPATPAASVSQCRCVPWVRRRAWCWPTSDGVSQRSQAGQAGDSSARAVRLTHVVPVQALAVLQQSTQPKCLSTTSRHLPQALGAEGSPHLPAFPSLPSDEPPARSSLPAQPLPHVLGGVPPLRRQLPALRVIHRRVEDGDADIAGLKAQGKRDP